MGCDQVPKAIVAPCKQGRSRFRLSCERRVSSTASEPWPHSGDGANPMFDREQLRQAIRAHQFRPFSVQLTDGSVFFAAASEYVAMSAHRSGVEVVIYDARSCHMIDLRHIVALSVH